MTTGSPRSTQVFFLRRYFLHQHIIPMKELIERGGGVDPLVPKNGLVRKKNLSTMFILNTLTTNIAVTCTISL